MKKVLLVAPLPPPYGGISHWTTIVLEHSKKQGRMPIQLVNTAPRYKSIFDRSFMKRVVRGIPSLITQLAQTIRAIPNRNVVAIHVISTGSYARARDIGILLLAKLFRQRSILHIRSGRVPALLGSDGVESMAIRLALRVANHVIAIDSGTTYAIRQYLPSVVVSTVPNCIDLSALPEIPHRKEQTILFVGWVLPAKGVEDLLAAWSKIMRRDWRLKIVGPYSDDYRVELAQRHDLEGVEITGELEHSDVLAEMSNAAIFCLPSYTEGFPNVILEAMALSCAIVATSVGAIPEMLAEGTGVIVDRGEKDDLADKIAALMNNPDVRERMGARAKGRAEKKYAISCVYKAYERIWKGGQTE